MDTIELSNILALDRVTARVFRGVYPLDYINKTSFRSGVYICNTQPSTKKGEHWVAVWISRNRRGYYFDSFGLPPVLPELITFLGKCTSWSYNKRPLQHPGTSVCGQYCVLFARFCALGKIKGMFMIFSGNTLDNDRTALEYINEHFDTNKPLIDLDVKFNQVGY